MLSVKRSLSGITSMCQLSTDKLSTLATLVELMNFNVTFWSVTRARVFCRQPTTKQIEKYDGKEKIEKVPG